MAWRHCCRTVALLAALSASVCGWSAGYQSKTLNPRHLTELRKHINACREKVGRASTAEERSLCQEELCKKLIQAEDFDAALEVARSVKDSPGVNPERRAAHHFLIAQIYALKMQASPSTELMDRNRRSAIAAAQQVVQQGYPQAWMVGDAAQGLLRDLQDSGHMGEVQAWVQKRETGGDDAAMMAAARAQRISLERSIAGEKTTDKKKFSLFGFGNNSSSSRATAQPARDKLMGLGRSASVTWDANGKPSVSRSVSSSASGDESSRRTSGVPSEFIRRSENNRTALSSPILLDGVSVRKAERIQEAVATDTSAESRMSQKSTDTKRSSLATRSATQVYADSVQPSSPAGTGDSSVPSLSAQQESQSPRPRTTDNTSLSNRQKLAAIFGKKPAKTQ